MLKGEKKTSTLCSCVCLVLIVFCDISADAEPEENQVLVVRASRTPGMCIGSVSVAFYCWVETRRKLNHINRPIGPSLAVPEALSDEGELGVVALLHPPQCVRYEGKFCLLSSCPLCMALILEECDFESSFLILFK